MFLRACRSSTPANRILFFCKRTCGKWVLARVTYSETALLQRCVKTMKFSYINFKDSASAFSIISSIGVFEITQLLNGWM